MLKKNKENLSGNVVKRDQGSERPILINMTEAFSLLGYNSSPVVKELVNVGFLKRFKLTDIKRTYVDRHEVESLIRSGERNYTPKGFSILNECS